MLVRDECWLSPALDIPAAPESARVDSARCNLDEVLARRRSRLAESIVSPALDAVVLTLTSMKLASASGDRRKRCVSQQRWYPSALAAQKYPSVALIDVNTRPSMSVGGATTGSAAFHHSSASSVGRCERDVPQHETRPSSVIPQVEASEAAIVVRRNGTARTLPSMPAAGPVSAAVLGASYASSRSSQTAIVARVSGASVQSCCVEHSVPSKTPRRSSAVMSVKCCSGRLTMNGSRCAGAENWASPQQITSPVLRSPQVLSPSAYRSENTSPSGALDCPASLAPQQRMSPFRRSETCAWGKITRLD